MTALEAFLRVCVFHKVTLILFIDIDSLILSWYLLLDTVFANFCGRAGRLLTI